MKSSYKLIACIFAAALTLQGCVKDYVKIIPQEEDQAAVLEDDVTKTLKAVEGVIDVQKVMVKDNDGKDVANYFFYYSQPMDHADPQKGTFYQQVAMQLSEPSAPVIVHTQGYAMEMKGSGAYSNDLCTTLGANWVEIEHRYFGNSQPEPKDSVQMTYLYTAQAASDIHRVVEMLRTNLFKSNKWVATGVSKGGITAGLQAYYSDKYGWKDFDLYVPFCAPYLAGTPASPSDVSVGKYIVYSCGNGYDQGSAEYKAYFRVQKILQQAVTKPRLRNALLRKFHISEPDNYKKVLDFYGPREMYALCAALDSHMESLLGFYSAYDFSKWAPLVPDPDLIKNGPEDGTTDDAQAIAAVCDYFFMTSDDLGEKLQGAQGPETKATHTEQDMIRTRASDKNMPYGVQSVRELGCVGIDYSWIPKDAFISESLALMVADKVCSRARAWDFYEGQWDGGKLMTDFRKWVYTENTQKIVFVYGGNDPWTGGAIDNEAAEANANVVKIMNPGGTHTDDFLQPDKYTAEATKEIKDAVSAFLR